MEEAIAAYSISFTVVIHVVALALGLTALTIKLIGYK